MKFTPELRPRVQKILRNEFKVFAIFDPLLKPMFNKMYISDDVEAYPTFSICSCEEINVNKMTGRKVLLHLANNTFVDGGWAKARY